MNIIKETSKVREQIVFWKRDGLSIGLVPTMGYLHEGHMSLIERAAGENDRVVVSVFVNPMQFGSSQDLEGYPRDMDRDAKICEDAGASLIFNPEVGEMYKPGASTFVDMTALTESLCGKARPGHFKGVCTVVAKLFNIVSPDRAYFGRKDAQQLAVISQMVRDLNFDLEVIGCPTVRESDGLAKSSRNVHLNKEEREAALILNKALQHGKSMIASGEKNADKICTAIREMIATEALADIDYIEIVSWDRLEPVAEIKESVLVAVAVYIGSTRLIDNFITE